MTGPFEDPTGEQLQRMVLEWPWVRPANATAQALVVAAVSGLGLVSGLGFCLLWIERRGGGQVEATVAVHSEDARRLGGQLRSYTGVAELRSYTGVAASPLGAALIGCWRAFRALCGQPVDGVQFPADLVADIDTMVTRALVTGSLTPHDLSSSWERIEELFPGRECPTEVLAMASIRIASRVDLS